MTSDNAPAPDKPSFRVPGTVILLPTVLSETGYAALPEILRMEASACEVFFVEEIRTARRFIRKLIPDFDIDGRQWHETDLKDPQISAAFKKSLISGQTIGIMSEAGCPGIADPGQELVAIAQEMGARVRPVTGPSAIFLALMASGFNGQSFRFHGYLPIESDRRKKALKDLEHESARTGCTQIFIETPYRNEAMLDAMLEVCRPDTRVCIGLEITGQPEDIRTLRISDWKRQRPHMHKIPAIFLLSAG